jgi:diacylglycerol O-acyltransferase / wax synthase
VIAERLTSLDGSFLRVETPNAHMHVAWSALFDRSSNASPPLLDDLRASVAGRLAQAPRFRRRLRHPAGGLGEPFWVDDSSFAIERHVVALAGPDEELTRADFDARCDAALSEPLERDHPLWRFYLAPRVAGGRCGLLAKIHHALVDGKSAVEVALLLFDVERDAPLVLPTDWLPEPERGGTRLTIDALAGGAAESLRAARSLAGGGPRLAGTLRRAALAVGDDLLRPAPSSFLNVSIGPRRTLVHARARMADARRAKQAAGTTLNDVCLAAVAGALRELAMARGEAPSPLKVMVPVSVREDSQRGDLGNRISLAFIDLPLDVSSPRERLLAVHRATSEFKLSGRAAGTDTVLSALGMLPGPLRGTAARAVGSARVYNLTVSNIPGPDFPLYMLGCELREAYPVVPIAEAHALSVGVFSYRDHLHFGLYADPEALPDVRWLPGALSAAVLSLARAAAAAGTRQRRGRPAAPAPLGVRRA